MESTLWAAFALGAGSSIHCTLMCTPLMMSFSAKSVKSQLVYQSGRLLSYMMLGLAIAGIGRAFWLIGIQNHLSVIAGIFMIGLVLLPERWFFSGAVFSGIIRLKTGLQARLKVQGRLNGFLLGMLNGLLPCPMVYVALAGAVAANDLPSAALWMAIFGLGTLPLIWVVIFGLFKLSKFQVAQHGLKYASPVLAVIVGCLLILRGINLEIPFVAHKIHFNSNTSTTEASVCK